MKLSVTGTGCRCHTAQLPIAPALALVLLPKCPLCLAAWLGILGTFGSGSWLPAALLSLALGAFAVSAWRSGDVRPLLAGALGSAAILAGKWAMDSPVLLYAGLALVAAASLWGRRVHGGGFEAVARGNA